MIILKLNSAELCTVKFYLSIPLNLIQERIILSDKSFDDSTSAFEIVY